MPKARKKAPRQVAPQSREEATRLIASYIALLDEIEAEKALAQTRLDEIVATRDHVLGPLEDEMKDIFKQLRPWWAVAKDELTDGKRKSIELAGAQIGERTSTPALTLPRGLTLDQFAAWMNDNDLEALVRTKHSPDKPACIKALRALGAPGPDANATDAEVILDVILRSQGAQLAAKGVTVTQKDEFFIDRAGRKDEATELVDVVEAGEAA